LQTGVVTNVIVDTFTISEPFGYEFYQGDSSYNQNYDDMVFDVLHYKYERVEADLFVSPDGDDNNSGLTGGEPLRTLNHALQIISADAERPRTIYLANGIYSSLINEQRFPVSLRSYVSIIGESAENTIIDLGAGHQGFALDLFGDLGYDLKNFTVRNGFIDNDDSFYNMLFYPLNSNFSPEPVLMENLIIENNVYDFLIFSSTINITLRNIIFRNNTYNVPNDYNTNCVSFSTVVYYQVSSDILIENCRFIDNQSGALGLMGDGVPDPSSHQVDIINCEFSGSENIYMDFLDPPFGVNIVCYGGMELNIVNCTFTDNYLSGANMSNAPIRLDYGSYVEIINSIIYGIDSHSLAILGYNNPPPVVHVHHSIIENGMSGIITGGSYYLNWDNETTWDVDPLFMNEGDYPYSLQEGSPAIDMGTLNLPEGVVLPEYDLAGNPRILGNGIDLGAYEYNPFSQPPVSTDGEPGDPGLVYYPNPVRLNKGREAVYIAFRSSRGDKESKLGIFNIRGQKVWEQDIETGTGGIRWDCSDMNGRKLAAGIYFLRISQDGRFLEQGKLTILK
jgi:hypothetical protein